MKAEGENARHDAGGGAAPKRSPRNEPSSVYVRARARSQRGGASLLLQGPADTWAWEKNGGGTAVSTTVRKQPVIGDEITQLRLDTCIRCRRLASARYERTGHFEWNARSLARSEREKIFIGFSETGFS